MSYRGRNNRGDNGQNTRGNRGGGGNTGSQNEACRWCKKTNHPSNDCRYRNDENANNSTNRGGRNGRGGNGTHCAYCNKLGHTIENCFQNPASPNYKGPGRQRGNGGVNSVQTCEVCGFSDHLVSNCRISNGDRVYNGAQPPNVRRSPCQGNAFGQPIQGSNCRETTFNASPQQSFPQQPFAQQPFAQYRTTDPNFAPQVRTNGGWSRRCKGCQKWHADCGKEQRNSSQASERDTKMVNSGFDSDDEEEEPRWPQALPFLKRTGLKWLCPWTGFAFEVDSEGDVIMLEAVSAPLPLPQPVQNFAYTRWQTDQDLGWDLPFKPPHLLNRIPRELWPTNHQAAHKYGYV